MVYVLAIIFCVLQNHFVSNEIELFKKSSIANFALLQFKSALCGKFGNQGNEIAEVYQLSSL